MITLVIGTNRPGSNTRKVARHVEQIYAELKVPLRVLDLAQMPAEIFSPTSYAEKPAAFRPFAEGVLQASGLHVVTPEYNGSVPGVLKYFIDMLKFRESFGAGSFQDVEAHCARGLLHVLAPLAAERLEAETRPP